MHDRDLAFRQRPGVANGVLESDPGDPIPGHGFKAPNGANQRLAALSYGMGAARRPESGTTRDAVWRFDDKALTNP
jgi:hypothetical protein